MLEDFEEERLDSKQLKGDSFEPHELMGHRIAALGDPGWAIYEDIDSYGQGDVLLALTEDLIEKDEEELVGSYWRQFQEADTDLNNPDEHIYSRLDEAGMDEENIQYLEDEYEQHIQPILEGTAFSSN